MQFGTLSTHKSLVSGTDLGWRVVWYYENSPDAGSCLAESALQTIAFLTLHQWSSTPGTETRKNMLAGGRMSILRLAADQQLEATPTAPEAGMLVAVSPSSPQPEVRGALVATQAQLLELGDCQTDIRVRGNVDGMESEMLQVVISFTYVYSGKTLVMRILLR